MFLNNKYTRWYYNIINSRKVNILFDVDYGEKHHIIPKSMGGSNRKDNIVKLTAREHFIVHWLLTKMCSNKDHTIKMLYALGRMRHTAKDSQRLESRFYEIAKKANQIALKSDEKLKMPRSDETKAKIKKARARQIITEETKVLWSKNRKGIPKSDEHKQKISEANKGKHSMKRTDEQRKAHSLALKGINKGKIHQIVKCPHCAKEGGAPIMKRHHFDNCKFM